MSLNQTIKENSKIFYDSLRSGGGFFPREADDDLNTSNIKVIRAMEKEFGEAWLVKINIYKPDEDPMIKAVTEGDGYNCYNFCCSMIIPKFDAKLKEMILKRLDQKYESTSKDGCAVDNIMDYAESVGAVTLVWA